MRFTDSARRHRPFVLATFCSLIFCSANAHIKNEATQFPDIEFSDARFDIVVLVGAGIIPETPVFEPDKALSNLELATWVALAEGLRLGGETPDIDALAAAALEKGYIDTLAGTATLQDVDRLFFDGQHGAAANDAPTKAQAATFIAAQLNTEAGSALLKKRHLVAGGGGDVTAVVIREGHHGNAYVMTIGGESLPMDEHGRVANGPTDLLQWEGRKVRRSFVRGSGDHAKWLYIEAEPRDEPRDESQEVGAVPTTADAKVEPPQTDRRMLYWLLAAGAILAVGLFFRRRKSS